MKEKNVIERTEYEVVEIEKKYVVLRNGSEEINEPKYKMPMGFEKGGKVYKTTGGFFELN